MTQKQILVMCIAFFLIMVLFNISIKNTPDAKEHIASLSENIKEMSKWNDCIAPDFKINLPDGSRFTLSENIGKKIIILSFFTTWCDPSKTEVKIFNEFIAENRDNPMILISISNEHKLIVKEFASSNGILYPLISDQLEVIAGRYEITAYPTTIFIGVDGKIQLYKTGIINNTDVYFKPAMKRNLEILKSGKAIKSKSEYLELLSLQLQKQYPNEPAQRIIREMFCPDHPEKLLVEDTCDTREEIFEMINHPYINETDLEVIKELESKFGVSK